MKIRLLALLATIAFGTAPAWAMDCCKDGKCACCAEMKKDGDKPAPKM